MEIEQIILLASALGVLIWLAIQDIRYGLLPNVGTYPLGALAITYSFVVEGPEALFISTLAGLYIACGFLLLRLGARKFVGKREALGLGDVKLAFGMGVFIGFDALGEWIIIAGVIGVAWLLVQSHLQSRPISRARIVFGPALIVSGILIYGWDLAGEKILSLG